jgi:outer membrane receptor protein involved in Fe transport
MMLAVGVSSALAQHSIGIITGEIRLTEKVSLQELKIQLIESSTRSMVQSIEADETGKFVFRNVSFAGYRIEVRRDTTLLARKSVVVSSTIPINVVITSLGEYRISEVEVVADAEKPFSGSSHMFFTAATIATLPRISQTKAIESMLLSSGSVVPDEDGRMHVRGEDAQFQYIIDGIPVTGNMTRIYSSLFDAGIIKSADLQTGGFTAEYGVATGGVLSVTTKSGFDAPFFVGGSVNYGSFNTKEAGVQLGGNIGEKNALFIAGSVSMTDRYLDPISGFNAIHTDGDNTHFFGKFNSILSPSIELSILGSVNGTMFSIPNFTDSSKQNQAQKQNDNMIGARLSIATGDDGLLSVVGYRRYAEAALTSGGIDRISSDADRTKAIAENDGLFLGAKRKNTVIGGQAEYSFTSNWFGVAHTSKVGFGVESLPLEEFFTFAPTDSLKANVQPFALSQSNTAQRTSGYIQDYFRYGRWSFSAGLRFDRYSLFEDEQQLSPRVGIGYSLTDNLTLRLSYNRMFMQAPVENILVSSSSEARVLSAEQGTLSNHVKAQKSHTIEIGAGWKANEFLDIDVVGYGKLIDDFLVKAELGVSGIIFPVNLTQGFVGGGEINARLHNWNNFSARLSVGVCASLGLIPEDGSSTVSGGLLIGEEGHNYSHPFRGEEFFPTEHNQLVTAALNVNYALMENLGLTLGSHFDLGLPFDLTDANGVGLTEEASRAELKRRGYSDEIINLLDLSVEKEGSPDKATAPRVTFDIGAYFDWKPLRISAVMTNILDTPYLYKFESALGGTHFGLPRSFAVRVEYR